MDSACGDRRDEVQDYNVSALQVQIVTTLPRYSWVPGPKSASWWEELPESIKGGTKGSFVLSLAPALMTLSLSRACCTSLGIYCFSNSLKRFWLFHLRADFRMPMKPPYLFWYDLAGDISFLPFFLPCLLLLLLKLILKRQGALSIVGGVRLAAQIPLVHPESPGHGIVPLQRKGQQQTPLHWLLLLFGKQGLHLLLRSFPHGTTEGEIKLRGIRQSPAW
ncbi:hypothetical protein EYF80_031034 [Liparis tanakae]|uniref:Uncharacterized protein n=1 Tax=Liparis tanakae TaxID=230148 RepID=A0A4Z2GZ83_9TELE|nr:hypothetical protein EYF80_031034 [Liparis tanakae]